MPPEPLDAAIIFATVGDLVPVALRAVRKGGRVVCAGIHMSDIPSFPYRLLWEERQLVSVANLTRQDGIDFLRLAPEIAIVTKTTPYPLNQAIRPSPISVPAGLKAQQFWSPESEDPRGIQTKHIHVVLFDAVSTHLGGSSSHCVILD
jgi:hypothetical protein